jgi:hypothetical protein
MREVMWENIIYREFYDVPRCIVFQFNGHGFYMDSIFMESIDNYDCNYHVYLMPLSLCRMPPTGSWENLKESAIGFLCTIAVDRIQFDDSKRKQIKVEPLLKYLV